MKIVMKKQKEVNVTHILLGDCFLYRGDLCMRIDGPYNDLYPVCVVYLSNGRKNGFKDSIMVEPVNAVVTVED